MRRLELLSCKEILGIARPKELVDAAIEALAEGQDSRSLRVLAGLTSADTAEVRSAFHQAQLELGIRIPSKRDAVLRLAQKIAEQILNGTISSHSGAQEIWELTLILPEEDLTELDTFVYAASEWNYRPENHKLFADGIKEAARDLIDTR